MKRVLILADESNLTSACRQLGKRMDWLILREGLTGAREVVEMVLYVGMPPDNPQYQEFRTGKKKFVHWAETNGFMVVQWQGSPINPATGTYKSNVDVIMAIDAMQLAADIRPDVVVIGSGDADFSHLAMTLRRRGMRVEVAATAGNLSSQLKSAANVVLDLTDLMSTLPDL